LVEAPDEDLNNKVLQRRYGAIVEDIKIEELQYILLPILPI